MNINLPVFYLLCSIVFSLFLVVYAWRNPQGRAARSFAVAVLSSVLWMTGDVVERLTNSFAGQWTGQGICFFGVCLLPVTMLIFIYEYCGKSLGRNQIILLCVVPLVSWLMLLTNPIHDLFYSRVEFVAFAPARTEYGTYFWLVHLPYCYILSLFGYITVFLERQKAAPHYRPQISILLFSLCIPMTINILGVFKVIGEATYTSLSFPIFFSIMAFAVFRYRFLKSNPIAYETVFQTMRDGVIVLDTINVITDINPAAARSLGKSSKSIIGTSAEETFAPWPEMLARYRDATQPDALDSNAEIKLNLSGKQYYISVNVTPLKNLRGTIDGRIFTLRDVTDRKLNELSLETMAYYDPLTRLANRRCFEETANKALTESRQSGESLALLYFDLNRFKMINDTMGHAVGDELLKYVGARASSVLRTNDLIARLGGDEFAVLLTDCTRENIDLLVNRILETAQQPFTVGSHSLTASLSIGAAFFPENGATLTELLEHADTAMYQAKHNGGGLRVLELAAELNM